MDSQKRIIIWFLAIVGVFVTGIGAWQLATAVPTEPPRKDGKMSLPLDQTDWTKGAKNPKVTLTEYSDFQCPFCGQNYPWVEEVLAEHKDSVAFTYRHFPLSMHKNALPASYASEAAGKQGKFWEMADMLFKNQSEWSGSMSAQIIFEGYAKKLGLDVAEYKKDVVSDAVKEKVERDRKSALASSVNHTPTFFINGKLSDNPRDYQQLKALIEYAIERTPLEK
ncbi:MAG: thioredoxin domain-containing protein [bacterium]|nr:thioredoxin domain-containing protein [bacterium]